MTLGLYIHIPFCLQKCGYCDFVSYKYDTTLAERYIQGLKREMELVAGEMGSGGTTKNRVSTVFFGGGTPTVLEAGQLIDILGWSREYFSWGPEVEVTVEANPGTVSVEKLTALRQAGVNRLSLGVQAFQPELLKELGRIHSREQVYQAVEAARQAGFANISLDLMYGLPGQTSDQWQATLKQAVALDVEHISAYSLKIEEGTPFYSRWQAGQLTACDEDLEADMYQAAIAYLSQQGYEHYEISNFARPGKNCRHNLIYWTLEHYLGFGPAAHSFLNHRRSANTTDFKVYLQQVAQGKRPVTEDFPVSQEDLMGEYMFLGLRLLKKGVSPKAFAHYFGREIDTIYGKELEKMLRLGLLQQEGDKLVLTKAAIPIANEVFAQFV